MSEEEKFITPYFPSIEIGNAIIEYYLYRKDKLKSKFLKNNSHIKDNVLVEAWQFAQKLEKLKIEEKDMVRYIKKKYNNDK